MGRQKGEREETNGVRGKEECVGWMCVGGRWDVGRIDEGIDEVV